MPRTKKPTALQVLLGNPGHRAKADLGRNEPAPVIGLGSPPAHLDNVAKAHWFDLGPRLVQMRVLGESDAPLFATLCELHSRGVYLSGRIAKLRAIKRPSARDDRNLSALENSKLKNTLAYARISSEFGLGAAARTKIGVDNGQTEFGFGPGSAVGDMRPETPLERAKRIARGIPPDPDLQSLAGGLDA